MPDVFKAISPHYAFKYFLSSGRASWVSLTGVVLCISGSEATYADMGHFSHRAITVRFLTSLSKSVLLEWTTVTYFKFLIAQILHEGCSF